MKYYLNTKPQKSGDYEVHTEDCSTINVTDQKYVYVGDFIDCRNAVESANKLLCENYAPAKADGCAICSPECDNDK